MICEFCREPSADTSPGWLIVHHKLHCERKECIRKCPECQDDFIAIGGNEKADKPSPVRRSPPPMIVELTPEESAICIEQGEKRQNTHKEGHGTRPWNGDENLVENHILGAKAECATRKTFGLDPKPTLLSGGDGGRGDLLLPNGKTVSVKMKRAWYPKTWFAYANDKEMLDDYGILAVPARRNVGAKELRHIALLGYISRENFNERKEPLPEDVAVAHPGYGVLPIEMNNVRDLLNFSGGSSHQAGGDPPRRSPPVTGELPTGGTRQPPPDYLQLLARARKEEVCEET